MSTQHEHEHEERERPFLPPTARHLRLAAVTLLHQHAGDGPGVESVLGELGLHPGDPVHLDVARFVVQLSALAVEMVARSDTGDPFVGSPWVELRAIAVHQAALESGASR